MFFFVSLIRLILFLLRCIIDRNMITYLCVAFVSGNDQWGSKDGLELSTQEVLTIKVIPKKKM